MDQDRGPDATGRRRFLREMTLLLAGAPVAWAAACTRTRTPGDPGGPDADRDVPEADPDDAADVPDAPGAEEVTTPPSRTLSPARFACLGALVDALVPGDDGAGNRTPGAASAGAAPYVGGLLGAFAGDPPRLFAGGPYSGRHGGLDGFSSFVPPTRVEEIAWRIRIEGTRGLSERAFAKAGVGVKAAAGAELPGLLAMYEAGLDDLDALAAAQGYANFAEMPLDDRRGLLQGGEARLDLRAAFEHAVEGTYGDPVYGGNRDLCGWKAIDYEGDRQPVGYTARQMSHPEEG
jgi:hypothetical protein